MKKIAVIGAGTMGNGIAHVFAQKGCRVNLIDISQEALNFGIVTITKNLDRMIAKKKISEAVKTATLKNISIQTNISEGAKNVDLVVEAASEKLDIKLKIFKELDSICDSQTILASNTSSISISQIAASTTRATKVIGMHFMNPVPLMQLVEVIRGRKTSDETTMTIMNLSKELGKIPVEVNDAPGFVANRILMPMINEAIETLNNGIAGVSEIDTVMKLGMSHPMGPLQLADLIGLDVCLSIMTVLHEGFDNKKYAPSLLLVNMVSNGNLGIKTNKGFYDYSNSKKAVNVSSQFN